jgi:hypothetical protein
MFFLKTFFISATVLKVKTVTVTLDHIDIVVGLPYTIRAGAKVGD